MARTELFGVRNPQLRKARKGGFTAAKQERFFAVLAATCNVAAAMRSAKVSRETVYRYRNTRAAFRALWAEAVREAHGRLELMMLERMMNGTVKTTTKADGSIETIHEYPNHIALQLLRLHRETAVEAGIEHDPDDVEEARERILKRIDRLRERLAAEQGDGER